MLLSAVFLFVVELPNSEIPEELTNYSVYIHLSFPTLFPELLLTRSGEFNPFHKNLFAKEFFLA
jgi:hypothetical protein